MGNLCCCRKREHDADMNRLIYLMYLRIAETGREFVLSTPIELEKRHNKEFVALTNALSKKDCDYVIRQTSVRVIYVALKQYLAGLPVPLLVNNSNELTWWIRMADILSVVMVFKETENAFSMQTFYALKIKRKLKRLTQSKYMLTKLMISMLRAITWSRIQKQFRQSQLMNFINDMRNVFLKITIHHSRDSDIDVVMITVCFMVIYGTTIFGEDVDSCLVGIKRPSLITESTFDVKKRGLKKADKQKNPYNSELPSPTPEISIPFQSSRRHSDTMFFFQRVLRPDYFEFPQENEQEINTI